MVMLLCNINNNNDNGKIMGKYNNYIIIIKSGKCSCVDVA